MHVFLLVCVICANVRVRVCIACCVCILTVSCVECHPLSAADPLEHTDVATSNSKGACMEPQLSAAARRQHRILELVAEDSSKGGRLPPHTAAPAAGSSTSPTLRAKKVLSLVQARRQPADASEMLEHPSAAVSSIKESREAASLSQEEASRAAALRIHQLSRSSGQYPRSADTPADSIVEGVLSFLYISPCALIHVAAAWFVLTFLPPASACLLL